MLVFHSDSVCCRGCRTLAKAGSTQSASTMELDREPLRPAGDFADCTGAITGVAGGAAGTAWDGTGEAGNVMCRVASGDTGRRKGQANGVGAAPAAGSARGAVGLAGLSAKNAALGGSVRMLTGELAGIAASWRDDMAPTSRCGRGRRWSGQRRQCLNSKQTACD